MPNREQEVSNNTFLKKIDVFWDSMSYSLVGNYSPVVASSTFTPLISLFKQIDTETSLLTC